MIQLRKQKIINNNLKGTDIIRAGFVRLSPLKFYAEVSPIKGLSNHKIWLIKRDGSWLVKETLTSNDGSIKPKDLYSGPIDNGTDMLAIIDSKKTNKLSN